MEFTQENITKLPYKHCLVFASNESGIHGSGSAETALKHFGAIMCRGFGPMNRSFAIPTKDWRIRTLPIFTIQFYVDRFIEYAKIHEDITFHVTKIGCGHAGYTPKDIAPLFINAMNLKNIILPKEFWEINRPNSSKFSVSDDVLTPYGKGYISQDKDCDNIYGVTIIYPSGEGYVFPGSTISVHESNLEKIERS